MVTALSALLLLLLVLCAAHDPAPASSASAIAPETQLFKPSCRESTGFERFEGAAVSALGDLAAATVADSAAISRTLTKMDFKLGAVGPLASVLVFLMLGTVSCQRLNERAYWFTPQPRRVESSARAARASAASDVDYSAAIQVTTTAAASSAA